MVKSYLRYEPALSFGVITSVDSNISYDSSGKYLLAGALEKVGVWHMRQGVCNKTLAPTASSSSRGHALAVTSLASSPTSFVISSSNPFYLFCFVFFLKDILQLVNVVVLFIYLFFELLCLLLQAGRMCPNTIFRFFRCNFPYFSVLSPE